ncbi:MAG: flavodoxin domain-containing protein [Candidatus Marinimicrobia bacterium]|nr:flavodoxin domain-containing protein [Candidatus Neomarinimicrobiota bacterium]
MKTLIVYASKHGCAKSAAEKLAQAFGTDTELSDVRNITRIDLENFDRIIIGGSIHAGRIQGQIKTFTQRNLNLLLQKQLGLYICHMEEGDGAMKELADNFPGQLLEHATAKGLFGGEFDFDKMNFIEKFMIKKVAHVTESLSKINEDNIHEFIKTMKD